MGNLTRPAGGGSSNTTTAVSVHATAAQSVTTATDTAIVFDAESWDTDNLHSTVTNNTRITFGATGKYRVSGGLSYAGNATGLRYVSLRINGTTTVLAGVTIGGSTNLNRLPFALVLSLSAGDYIELIARQTSGGALNVNSGSSETYLQVQRES